jgi:hypothetical protein
MVLLILTLVAVGVSVLVYFITKKTYNEEMYSEYDAASSRLLDAFDAIRTDRIATLASLAIAAIAHGVDHSRDWPFVSLSSYQQRAFVAKLNSGALQVSIVPFVPEDNRSAWEEYIVSDEAEVDWIERSIVYQEEVGADQYIKDYGNSFRNDSKHSIKGWSGQTVDAPAVPLTKGGEQGYLPYWEMSPFLSFDEVNIDMLQDNTGGYGIDCLDEGAIVIGNMTSQPPGGIDSPYRTTSAYAQLLSIEAGSEVAYQGDPMSYVFIPIFDSFDENRKAKALLVGLFNWGIIFRDLLPKGITGIDIVIENDCGGVFTYRLMNNDGNGNVLPLGPGVCISKCCLFFDCSQYSPDLTSFFTTLIQDLHDANFDDWGLQTSVLQSGITADGTQGGLPFAQNGSCVYHMSIYPSVIFVQNYYSPIPAVLVAVVAFVFVFAIFLFLFYDRLVERRQTLVLQKAVQSTAIVSSLFPSNVRDRLMKSAAAATDANGVIPAIRDRLRTAKDGNDLKINKTDSNSEDIAHIGDAIADLFPNCTVLFAVGSVVCFFICPLHFPVLA